LTNKNKQLEEENEDCHEKIKELKGNEDEGNDYKKDLENAMRKLNLLEQELEDSDKSLKETTSR
jgi:tropomyosin